jgi:hypothetical protein
MGHSYLIKLNRILGMLGSDHPGERASAALAAHRLVKSAGTTWWDLIGGRVRAESPLRGHAGVRIVYVHEWGVDHARAAEARIRQLRSENDTLRKEVKSLKQRLAVRADQTRRSRLPNGQ